MTTYKNTAGELRVWPSIQRPDGRTLELEASETADLDLPTNFEDPYLQVVSAKKETKAEAAKREKTEAAEAATESVVATAAGANPESKEH
jgi:hypothetical protein